MKISKLILPVMALTTLNNPNNSQVKAIQIEKEVNIPYEVLVRDNWDNCYLTNANTTENTTYSQQDKDVLSANLVCADILDAANACWNDWNKIRAAACYASAMALYAACIAATSV